MPDKKTKNDQKRKKYFLDRISIKKTATKILYNLTDSPTNNKTYISGVLPNNKKLSSGNMNGPGNKTKV